MRCPFCKVDDDKVIDSRASSDGFAIRRRRECVDCGRRFTTYERIEESPLRVIKKEGVREPFERRKILFGLIKWRSGEVHGEQVKSRRFFFVSRFEDRLDNETGERIVNRDLWPFFRTSKRIAADGRTFGRVVAPWLIPIRGEGFHRHLLGMLTLYEKTYTEDQVRSDFLWGLARYRRKPGYAFDAFAWWSREQREPLESAVSAQYMGVPGR